MSVEECDGVTDEACGLGGMKERINLRVRGKKMEYKVAGSESKGK